MYHLTLDVRCHPCKIRGPRRRAVKLTSFDDPCDRILAAAECGIEHHGIRRTKMEDIPVRDVVALVQTRVSGAMACLATLAVLVRYTGPETSA